MKTDSGIPLPEVAATLRRLAAGPLTLEKNPDVTRRYLLRAAAYLERLPRD